MSCNLLRSAVTHGFMAINTTAIHMTIEPVTCDHALLLLSRGLDGDLSNAETRVMYAHLAGCDDCRRAMGELAGVDCALKALSRPYEDAELGADFHAHLMHRLDWQPAQSQPGATPLQRFGRQVAQDARLRRKLAEAANEAAFVALYVELGQASGYQFQATEVTRLLHAAAANDELSDAQLDQVAAAGTPFNSQKMLDWLSTWPDTPNTAK